MNAVPMVYPYVQPEILRRRKPYAYSPHCGLAFLEAYLVQRERTLAACTERLRAWLGRPSPRDQGAPLAAWRDLGAEFEPLLAADPVALFGCEVAGRAGDAGKLEAADGPEGFPRSGPVSTEALLRTLVRQAWGPGGADLGQPGDTLARLARRFEIARRLPVALTALGRRAGPDGDAPLNDILLALALLRVFRLRGRLRLLNAALKVQDHLCAAAETLLEGEGLALFAVALRLELEAIKGLLAARGLAP